MITNCWMGHGFMFGGPFGMIIGMAFWLLLIFGAIYIVSHLLKAKSNNTFHKESALDILKRKYANGELDADEYENRKATILS